MAVLTEIVWNDEQGFVIKESGVPVKFLGMTDNFHVEIDRDASDADVRRKIEQYASLHDIGANGYICGGRIEVDRTMTMAVFAGLRYRDIKEPAGAR